MTRAADLPLPAYRHVPGENARPDEATFAAVKRMVPAETRSATAADNVAWRYGLRLLDAGFYWEAHEVLEPVWLAAAPNSRERHLVQAVIHLANGRLKDVMGRPNARLRLAGLARQGLEAAFPAGEGTLMGLDGSVVLQAAERLAAGEPGFALSRDDAR